MREPQTLSDLPVGANGWRWVAWAVALGGDPHAELYDSKDEERHQIKIFVWRNRTSFDQLAFVTVGECSARNLPAKAELYAKAQARLTQLTDPLLRLELLVPGKRPR